MKGSAFLCALGSLAAAAPLIDEAPKATAGAIDHARSPEPTPAPRLEDRGLGDTIKSDVGSVVTEVESKISGFVESGILNFPTGFPTGTDAEKSLGVSSSDLAAIPTQVLNLP